MDTPACGITPQLLPLHPQERGSCCSAGLGVSWKLGMRPPGMVNIGIAVFPSHPSPHRTKERQAASSTRPFVFQLKTNTK